MKAQELNATFRRRWPRLIRRLTRLQNEKPATIAEAIGRRDAMLATLDEMRALIATTPDGLYRSVNAPVPELWG